MSNYVIIFSFKKNMYEVESYVFIAFSEMHFHSALICDARPVNSTNISDKYTLILKIYLNLWELLVLSSVNTWNLLWLYLDYSCTIFKICLIIHEFLFYLKFTTKPNFLHIKLACQWCSKSKLRWHKKASYLLKKK